MCYYNNVRSGQASRREQTQVVTVRPVKRKEHPENNPRQAAGKLLQKIFKKVLTKQPRGAIIKTQKGSERNERSSEVKPISQEIAETHSPKVMHIRAGQQCDRVLSEVRRRVEPVGILAHFYLTRRGRPAPPVFPLYYTSASLSIVNLHKFYTRRIPKFCAFCLLYYFIDVLYYNQGKGLRLDC